ncbi:MAG: hypothetical protein CMM35_06570, partial [Rhodospirillaceae bacterium]|nr:hypothetical protein [Rhodospirillaceae bacterium]
DYFDGGLGEDTLIVEDGPWNRGVIGDAQDAAYSDWRKEIDFTSVTPPVSLNTFRYATEAINFTEF